MTLEKLCTGTVWAEGPVWIDSEGSDSGGYLLWSDIPNNRMMRWSEQDGMSVWRDKVEFTNGHTLDLNGDLLHCSHGLRAIVRTPLVNGELRANTSDQIVVNQYLGKRLNSPNDLVVKRDGTIWFTDPSYGILSNHEGYKADREQAGHFVYCWNPLTEALTAMTDAVPISMLEDPNGLAFSPDERVLYVSDTSAARYQNGEGNHHITAFDVAKIEGGYALNNHRIFAVIEPGLPDGFRVDADGNLYTSSLDSVQVYSPKGKLLRKILVPEKIGNVCFGGKDKRDLYIVASTSVYRYHLEVFKSAPSA
jgi:gluconolactonase